MPNSRVLIDSSLWIEYFRKKTKVSDSVRKLVSSRKAISTGLIIAELLQGIRSTKESKIILEALNSIPTLEITNVIWTKAGQIAAILRSKGITIPLSDLAIASLAIDQNMTIYTLDNHFKKIPGVKLYHP